MPEWIQSFAQNFGDGVYLLLFAIIFIETGLIIFPFLPGDSLLFALGALSVTTGVLKLEYLLILLPFAAWSGDLVNYFVGKKLGSKIENLENQKWIKKEHLDKTQKFYEKHGAKMIFLARFIPIVRTYAPFVAGLGQMRFSKFILYSVSGGLTWIVSFLLLGYYFGNLPQVKSQFHIVIFAIIGVSVLPIAIEILKSKIKTQDSNTQFAQELSSKVKAGENK